MMASTNANANANANANGKTNTPPANDPFDTEIPALPTGVTITTLENGLTIIVQEDHSAPVVSAQAWCKAGSIDEGKWLGAGLSHVLEHMLFKGTANRGPGQIDQEIHDAGGSMNAYTSFDRTVFWINVPNTGSTIAVDILCDIMQHATLPEEELAKEMDVIRREMDMCQDDPARRSSRRLFEVAYTQSPYRYTIIGYPDIFNELTREDIFAYYREKYAPNNVGFIVSGDVQPDQVIDQIRQAYASTKSKPLPPAVLPQEPKQTAPRETIEEGPVELGYCHFSWHIPDLRHPDVPSLDVLSTLLGEGRSCRLYQEVRENQALVHSIDAWTYSPGNPGLFGISAIVDADRFSQARTAILAEIDKMKNDPISEEELTKAVKQLTAATLSSRKSMQGQAQDLGSSWLAAHDLNFSERYLAAVRRLTPADLQRVAREYLTPENRTLYALLPTQTAPRESKVHAVTREQPIQKFDLPNGLRLLVKEDHRLPFVEIRTVFQGGVLAESEPQNGLTQLTARMLLKGTQNRTAEQIAGEIESLGGAIDSYGANNSFGVQSEVLSSDVDTGLNLVAEVLLSPTFPAAALERERQVQLAGIKVQKDQLLSSAVRALRRQLFGNTGYGLDSIGTEESVQAIQVADLQAFHQQWVAPNNCVLSIFGDINPDHIRSQVEKIFGSWSPGTAFQLPSPPAFPAGVQRVDEPRDKKQTVLLIGFPGTTVYHPDRYALELLQEACSDIGSRLFLRIREQLGLAYYVGAQNFLGRLPGYFAFYVGTSPEKAADVEEELFQEAELLRKEGLMQEELQRAKAKVIGHKKISRQELGFLAMSTALDELYGLGYTHIDEEEAAFESVTLDQIREVARKYLNPENCVVVHLHPENTSEAKSQEARVQ